MLEFVGGLIVGFIISLIYFRFRIKLFEKKLKEIEEKYKMLI